TSQTSTISLHDALPISSNLYTECLRLLNLTIINNVDNLRDILSKFIEPPTDININSSIRYLEKMNLIENGEINKLGRIVSDMQIDRKSTRLNSSHVKIS